VPAAREWFAIKHAQRLRRPRSRTVEEIRARSPAPSSVLDECHAVTIDER
jgi:hypothetical protein